MDIIMSVFAVSGHVAWLVFVVACLFVSTLCFCLYSPETLISSDCCADTHTKRGADCMNELLPVQSADPVTCVTTGGIQSPITPGGYI